MSATLVSQDWSAAGHDVARAWHEVIALVGPWAFALVIVALLVRALTLRRRYRAVGVLSAEDLDQLHADVRDAERRTVGEIVPVVLERSDDHPGANWRAALAFVLAGSLLLMEHLPWNVPELLLVLQLALGALGYVLARTVPGFGRVFVLERRATEMAEEQALQEFQRLGLSQTQAATGVLIFVSLFERRVVVLGDHGIHAKVGAQHWTTVDAAVLEGIRNGSLRAGLSAGIRACGDVLAQHFPWQAGDRNELSDRVVVRRK